jgi:hypothetical protein
MDGAGWLSLKGFDLALLALLLVVAVAPAGRTWRFGRLLTIMDVDVMVVVVVGARGMCIFEGTQAGK